MKINTFLYFSTFLIIFVSCSKENNDLPLNELIVVSSKQDSLYSDLDGLVTKFLNQNNRYFPMEEDYYNIKWIQPHQFKEYLHRPSIIFFKLKNPKDSTGDKLFNRIFQNRSEDSKINFVNNFYSNNQSIIGVESEDRIELSETLFKYDSAIRKQINLNINKLIFDRYSQKPLNKEIADKIKDKYGVDMYIHHEYENIKEIDDILWIGRGYPAWGDPYRWIIIREIDSCDSPKECHFYVQETFNSIYQSKDSTYISISDINQPESYKYMYKNNYIIGGSYVQSNIFDNSEFYIDSNNNNKYDFGEDFIDGNSKWDRYESYTDYNDNDKYDLGEDFDDRNRNGKWDNSEYYKDGNNNGLFDQGEYFVDLGNGVWDSSIDTIPNAGGPYISYIHKLEDKSILFIGLINMPDRNKMIYIKQMEEVFRNIK
mgnify:CR=1 FL=1